MRFLLRIAVEEKRTIHKARMVPPERELKHGRRGIHPAGRFLVDATPCAEIRPSAAPDMRCVGAIARDTPEMRARSAIPAMGNFGAETSSLYKDRGAICGKEIPEKGKFPNRT